MGNGQTRRGSRKRDNWYYIDKLPPRLRLALCDAAFTWDAKWFYDHWNKGKSVDWCIDQIKRADLNKALEPEKIRDGFKWRALPSITKETGVTPLYK
jgi:hypothetical protein